MAKAIKRPLIQSDSDESDFEQVETLSHFLCLHKP